LSHQLVAQVTVLVSVGVLQINQTLAQVVHGGLAIG
jgi:hypothetical protein